ncbi:MAG TPA: ZIP family metal transporter [Anaeromyxobacteraceae bacterium]|nr:ZIP family metal transporter [Anaeromyxobacteraceae bacterium]
MGAIGGAALLLLFPDRVRRVLVPCLVSYATGTLLGAAFLGMIPAGAARAPVQAVTATVLAGVIGFFVLEKLVVWRHCHRPHCDTHPRAGPLLLVGDAFHNFVDGVMIAAALVTSVPLGVSAALATIAHEVPQEVGDFAILLEDGYSRGRAFVLNALSSVATLPGALVGWAFLDEAREGLPYVLAISAASFVYVATADLIPALHARVGLGHTVRQVALIAAGIATIAAFRLG